MHDVLAVAHRRHALEQLVFDVCVQRDGHHASARVAVEVQVHLRHVHAKRARQHAERPEEIRRAASAWIVTAVFSSPRENRKAMKTSTFTEARIAFALKHFNGAPALAGREPRH